MDSILSIFKIGVGPSSSHTIGPIVAANRFCGEIFSNLEKITRIKVTLHGSLSLTGKGHLSDKACILGLTNIEPKDVSLKLKKKIFKDAFEKNRLKLCSYKYIDFEYEKDMIFNNNMLALHENGVTFEAFNENELLHVKTYYSTGGGFVLSEEELKKKSCKSKKKVCLKYDFDTAKKLVKLCKIHQKSIDEIVVLRESEMDEKKDVKSYCLEIYKAMEECFKSGISATDKVLPGAIKMKRLAPSIYKRLSEYKKEELDPLSMIDYISMYARAIAEENASGGRVVTAPTNGACGVVPAVLFYIKEHRFYMDEKQIVEFLLTCAAIGYLYKTNASISGAEAGCQAEIGVAASMTAAGMAKIAGGSINQILTAAEIAMEHHLGLTCDPVAGLVQIPCIERNVIGAIKAISAVKLALDGEYSAKVGLDDVIETMYKTGKDMNLKYKETSLGGLAQIVRC